MAEENEGVQKPEPVHKKREISEESAEKQFNDWIDYYFIDFDDIISDQGKNGAKKIKNVLVRAIRKGIIEFKQSSDPEEGFQVIQNTTTGKRIAYNEYNIVGLEEFDKGKGTSEAQFRLLGSLCGLGYDTLKSKKYMMAPDIKIAENISTIFLL